MITKKLESLAKYGGIVAVSFEWSAVLLFYLIQPDAFNGTHPISYFATLPQTRLIFGICYCLAALSFWVFTHYHFRKHYEVPAKLFTFSMLGFAAVATVPFDPSSPISTVLHSLLAQLFSLTFMAGMFLTGLRNNDKELRWASIVLAIISLAFMFSFLALPRNSSLILIFEALSGVMAQLWIVLTSLHGLRKLKLQKTEPL